MAAETGASAPAGAPAFSAGNARKPSILADPELAMPAHYSVVFEVHFALRDEAMFPGIPPAFLDTVIVKRTSTA